MLGELLGRPSRPKHRTPAPLGDPTSRSADDFIQDVSMEPSPSAPQRDRHPVRHRWLTGLLLLLSAILAVPVFVALYRALDVFGLPGALGILIAVSAILAVTWVVHLARTFGGTIVL